MNEDATAYEGRSPIERAFAHYHRLLGELLVTLVEDAAVETTWLDEGPHVIREDDKNEYARAIYRLKDLTPYGPDLAELRRVRKDAATLGANTDPLLEPVTREGINFVRVQTHRSFVGRWAEGPTVRGQIAQARDKLADLLARVHSHDPDARERELSDELAEADAALAALRDVEEVRMRWPTTRHYALLYDREGENERVYVPKPGVIATGETLTVTFADSRRRPRSDRVTLAPLATFNGREIFDANAWREATGQTD